ncbi:mechanosensitive ion channel protein MscS [uncultured Pontibacter sp.]|uniref:mechanosensitive ion channel protein MscS n=1 Tax=uncultured Pontibacter sp. TaxID=453356 RepID=UPI002606B78B|nr:mechanosensitive ion channel protein MscS [uncultured Pontibacter sp.]
MLKNILYAMLLGVGMAACLSQQDETQDKTTESAPEEALIPAITEEAAPQPDPALFVVGKQRVGNISIGMPVEQMRKQVASGLSIKDTTLQQEGIQSTAYVLHPEGQQKGLLIEQACNPKCQVWRISILSTDFRTAQDISVGSKYSELQQAYNIRTVTYEEGNLVALAPDAGMSFILDHSPLPTDQLPKLTATTAPANLLVKKILLY